MPQQLNRGNWHSGEITQLFFSLSIIIGLLQTDGWKDERDYSLRNLPLFKFQGVSD